MSHSLFSQKESITPSKVKDTAAIKKKKAKKAKLKDSIEITIKDYKIISYARDSTYLDTTLSIQKEYKYLLLLRNHSHFDATREIVNQLATF